MTLTELRYIVAVARDRHFGKAAESCFVSQPTLSVAVRKLEDELGVVLFERARNEVVPTAAGERIVAQALRVLEEAEAIRRLAHAGQDPLVGPLRIGVIATVGPYLLPHVVPVLHTLAPGMPLIIEEGLTGALVERLKQGELEALVLALPCAEPGLMVRPLYDEPFVVLLPSRHPWCARAAIPVAELEQETVLLPGEGNCLRDQVVAVAPGCLRRAAQGELQKALAGSSLETIRLMVASGVGIAVQPCSALVCPAAAPLLCQRPFAPPVPGRRVALVWRRSFPRSSAVEVLARAILTCGVECLSPV